MLIDFRERGKGREGERKRTIDVREKRGSVASHTCPDWEPNLQPRYVPWPGIEPAALQFMGWCSIQLSHNGQGGNVNFKKNYTLTKKCMNVLFIRKSCWPVGKNLAKSLLEFVMSAPADTKEENSHFLKNASGSSTASCWDLSLHPEHVQYLLLCDCCFALWPLKQRKKR